MSIFVLSLGFIIGFAGLVSLGHAAFFGLGAYLVALLAKYVTANTYLTILTAVAAAALLAFVTGALFIKTTGAYFLMITMAFSQVLYAVFYQWKKTGGADGMSVAATLDLGFGPIRGSYPMYYFMLVCFLLCSFLLHRYIHSPAGRATIGVKENEDRMRALGYKTRRYKLIAYTISGAMAGFAGALYACFNRFVSPETLAWHTSGEALVMAIVGGSAFLYGPPIGAAIFVILQNYISTYTERWPIIMGALFIAFVLANVGGVANVLAGLSRRLARSVSRGEKAEEAADIPKAAPSGRLGEGTGK